MHMFSLVHSWTTFLINSYLYSNHVNSSPQSCVRRKQHMLLPCQCGWGAGVLCHLLFFGLPTRCRGSRRQFYNVEKNLGPWSTIWRRAIQQAKTSIWTLCDLVINFSRGKPLMFENESVNGVTLTGTQGLYNWITPATIKGGKERENGQ